MGRYVHPKGEHRQWYHTASNLYGLIPCTKAEERKHREDHRYVKPKASHREVLDESIPTLLRLDSAKNVGVTHQLPCIPSVNFREAARYLPTEYDGELTKIRCYKSREDFSFFYVNVDPDDPREVDLNRIKKYRDSIMAGKGSYQTVAAFKKDCLSLHEVTVSAKRDVHPSLAAGDSCDCEYFWTYLMCPHLLACLDIESHVNIAESLKASHPPNKGKHQQQEKK